MHECELKDASYRSRTNNNKNIVFHPFFRRRVSGQRGPCTGHSVVVVVETIVFGKQDAARGRRDTAEPRPTDDDERGERNEETPALKSDGPRRYFFLGIVARDAWAGDAGYGSR